ncbi:MAG: DUF6033 family protein [Clostridium sp.]|nr:DUF6033 family protein [Clostridium sp.]MCM1399784.1 DUF6033 family protein [Clostridium sp.]MCM1459589.1 DUF6033 family protein [Bacteroides sp.]
MAIKVGDSWVSQEAYNYAKSRVDNANAQGSEGNSILVDLSKQYKDMNFSTNTQPFSSDGTKNIAISPTILRKMQEDPDARVEYEALIYDCVQGLRNEPLQHGAFTTVARGVIINPDGTCGGWSISQSGNDTKKTYRKTDAKELQERIKKQKEKKAKAEKAKKDTYEKSDTTAKKATYSVTKMSAEDRAKIVSQLKADEEARQQSLTNLVQNMLGKQANAYGIAKGGDAMWKFIASGNYTVDAATKAQAQKDISEDGYWGVKQTSQRLFDFASALAGDDVEKMKEMQAAMHKGFKLATKSWGRKLPDISNATLDAANKLFDDYYASKEQTTE